MTKAWTVAVLLGVAGCGSQAQGVDSAAGDTAVFVEGTGGTCGALRPRPVVSGSYMQDWGLYEERSPGVWTEIYSYGGPAYTDTIAVGTGWMDWERQGHEPCHSTYTVTVE